MTAPDVRTPGGNRADSGQTAADQSIVPATESADKAAARKRFKSLRARLCLHGHQLHELADGSFLVSRWNLTRDLADLNAVERFAVLVGA